MTAPSDVPGPRAQDSYEAIWEHVRQRPIGYPDPQYVNPIFMNPARFPWAPMEGTPGVDQKLLAVLTSARLKAACYRLAPRAAVTVTGRAIFIALSGTGSVDGDGYRKLSTVYLDDGEKAEFVADEITEIVQFGLPTLAQISPEPPTPSAEDEAAYASA